MKSRSWCLDSIRSMADEEIVIDGREEMVLDFLEVGCGRGIMLIWRWRWRKKVV